MKRCIHDKCANGALKGGVYWRHGAKSLATAPRGVKRHRPFEDHNVTTMDAIARRGREIGMCNPLTNISRAPACQLPSRRPSATAIDFSEDEKIGAWVYKYICPEHQQMSAQHVSKLLRKARENDLVIDGSRGLFIAAINES
jgi:hypothetical protein